MARYTETVYPIKKLVPLTAAMAEAISEYRHQQRISSENETIRRLIEAGLKSAKIAVSPPSGGSAPATTEKPAAPDKPDRTDNLSPRQRKPRASDRETKPAPRLSKEAQLRALREHTIR
jgi:hypothetical protein